MASIRQEEGFKEDVQRHIDLIQERFLAEIAERDEIEKNLRELLADKRDLADQLQSRERELERELTHQEEDFNRASETLVKRYEQ